MGRWTRNWQMVLTAIRKEDRGYRSALPSVSVSLCSQNQFLLIKIQVSAFLNMKMSFMWTKTAWLSLACKLVMAGYRQKSALDTCFIQVTRCVTYLQGK